MSFNIKSRIKMYLLIFVLGFIECKNSINRDGTYKIGVCKKDKDIILIMDSIIIDSRNLFCVQQFLINNSNEMKIENQCMTLGGDGVFLNSLLNVKKDSIFINGKEHYVFERTYLKPYENQINSITVNILNKPIDFPFYSIKLCSDGVFYVNEKRNSIKCLSSLHEIIKVEDLKSVYEDEFFFPGQPIFKVTFLLEDETVKYVKMFGWRDAPNELQILLMYLIGFSTMCN